MAKASESWTGVRVSALAGAAITALNKRSAPRPQRRSPERLRRRRCERFSLLHNVRDQNDALDVARDIQTCSKAASDPLATRKRFMAINIRSSPTLDGAMDT